MIAANNNCIIETRSGHLPSYLSAFEAEAVALNAALLFASSITNQYASIRIFSDSMSNIKSLISRIKQPEIVRKNQLLAIGTAQSTLLSIEWIPRHQGITGNEKADRLAKRRATDIKTPISRACPISISAITQQMNTMLWKRRDQEWKCSSTGSWTRQFLPSVKTARFFKTRPLTHQMIQLLTAHGKFKSYLFNSKIAPYPYCDVCINDPQTPEHFLFFCKKFEAKRNNLKNYCNRYVKQWSPLYT